MLMKSSAQSLTEQLAARFAQRIRDRLLAPGARLPSVRQCAQQQGVSPSTVVGAYDQLLAQGLVEARRNRGFFVRETSQTPAEFARARSKAPAAAPQPADASPHRAPLNATALIRGMFHGISDKPQPGMGVLPQDWLQTTFLASAVRRFCNAKDLNAFSLQYGEPAGDAGLRRAVAHKLKTVAVHKTSNAVNSVAFMGLTLS